MARHVFVHIGDTHLHPGPRQGDREDALQQIVDRAFELHTQRELAAILWPGDFFHQKSTPEDRNILASVLLRLADMAPVVGCYGNHDVAGDLEVFTKLSAAYPITIVDIPQVVTVRTATGLSVAVFCLPYPHRSGLVSAGAAHADIVPAAEHALDSIFMVGAQQLLDARAGGFVPLTIGHVNVGGSVVSTGQPNIGQEIELTPALLDRLPSGPVALNHIHRHQRLFERAIYAGSIARMDFGEMESKGFVEYTFDDQASQVQWSIEFRELDVPQQLHVEGELTRDGFRLDDDMRGLPAPFKGADVRVRYRYLKADAGVIDVDKIRKFFDGCRSLKLEGVPHGTHEMRAPEIAAAVTLEEKVLRYCERHGIAVSTQFKMKLASLQIDGMTGSNLIQILNEQLAKTGTSQPAEAAVA